MLEGVRLERGVWGLPTPHPRSKAKQSKERERESQPSLSLRKKRFEAKLYALNLRNQTLHPQPPGVTFEAALKTALQLG